MELVKLPSFNRSFMKSRGYSTTPRMPGSPLGRASRASSSKGSNRKSPAPPKDAEAEARDKLLATLLQKRRVLMAGFKEEDLRDVADVVKYGPADSAEQSTAPMIIHIRNALSIKPAQRMHASDSIIVSMLMHTAGLGDHIKACSERDLISLSKTCTSFVVTEGSEHVIASAGAVIDECYIIIKGSVERYQNPALAVDELEASVTPSEVKILDGHVETKGVASMLGLDVLGNRVKWDSDYVAHNGTCICVLSTQSLRRFVGLGGFRAEDVMECFWKYYKLWEYIYNAENKAMLLADALFGAPATFNSDFEKVESVPRLPIDVTSCARIKYFSPGQEIFSQGSPRDYLYVLIMGEASFVRRFPDWVEDIPVEVKIGLTLYPGDYSFMDGEDGEWASRNRKAHLEQGHLQEEIDESHEYDSTHNDAYRLLFAAKIRNRELVKNRYGVHKNTLIATTRAEVCVVPLAAVADSQNAFRGLLTITVGKYRLTLLSDENLIRRYHENRIWGLQKTRVIGKALGTELPLQKELVPPHHRSSTVNRSSKGSTSDLAPSRPTSSAASSRAFPGSLDQPASVSGDALSPDDVDIRIDDSNDQPRQPAQVIHLINHRQYLRPNSKPGSGSNLDSRGQSRSPSPKTLKPSSPERDRRLESVHRSAIQGVLFKESDGSKHSRRSKSPDHRQKGVSMYKGGSLSDRIKSFYKATSESPQLESHAAPTRPSGMKKSNQSIRARKSSKHSRENNENTTTGDINTGRKKQLTFIEEGLHEDSVGEQSSGSQGNARLDGVEVNPLLTGRKRSPRAKSRHGAPQFRVDDSELSLQAFAEKNAEMYVQKFRKKKAEMKFLADSNVTSAGTDKVVSSAASGGTIDRADSASREGVRTGGTAESGSSRRKMNMDEIISNLASSTAKSGSR